MYACNVCKKVFTSVKLFKNHLQNQIPCNFRCIKCGEKMRSAALYKKHIASACEPCERTKEEIEDMFGEKIEDVSPIIVNDPNDPNNNEVPNGAPSNEAPKYLKSVKEATNAAIERIPIVVEDSMEAIDTAIVVEMGIMPVELYKDEALKLHLAEIVDMLNEAAQGICTVEELFPNLFILLFSNVESPQYLSVVDNGVPPEGYYKIFNGLEYVKDFMTKDLRNSRFLQLMMYFFHTMTEVPMIEDKTVKFIKTKFLPHIVRAYVDERYHDFIQRRMVRNYEIIEKIGLPRVNDKYSEFVRFKLGRVAPRPPNHQGPYVPQPPLSYLITRNHVLKHIADYLSYESYMMDSIKLLRDHETDPIQRYTWSGLLRTEIPFPLPLLLLVMHERNIIH